VKQNALANRSQTKSGVKLWRFLPLNTLSMAKKKQLRNISK